MTDEKKKAPNPRPWMDVDPEPLPDEDAALLAEVYDYADMLTRAEKQADSVAMAKAEALERLYQRGAWVEEWNRARPPKPDAIGRPVDPMSRNRFAQWQAWRAQKTDRNWLESSRVYRLLNARKVATYFARGQSKSITERAVRPAVWLLTNGYEDRIPEVESLAVQIADGNPITDTVMKKAVSEWKAENLTRKDIDRGKAVARSRPIRKRCEDDFGQLLDQNPDEARAFIVWAQNAFREAAKSKFTVVAAQ